jgi:hypothetical protein
MMRAIVHVEIDDDDPAELRAFLIALRNWDRGRDAVRLSIQVECPTLSVDELRGILSDLDPPLPIRWIAPINRG